MRTLSIEDNDTKFFEKHRRLVTSLLDVRFDGEVSETGLEAFLDALADRDHWLLVMDLDGSLLPFRLQRVRGSELRETMPPGERVLIVENEACQHLLPAVPNAIAILGAGFDLSWTDAAWLKNKKIAYWGDVDTWGLHFLAKARRMMGALDALMMTAEIYEQYSGSAVSEPVVAGAEPPPELTRSEESLYNRLLAESCGRLEQEFLPESLIHDSVRAWAESSDCKPHDDP